MEGIAAGPGLIGGVIVGLTTAKAMAPVSGNPPIAVNHLEAHAPWATPAPSWGLRCEACTTPSRNAIQRLAQLG
jgi:hypothetical protein